jgi:hypothetical protein
MSIDTITDSPVAQSSVENETLEAVSPPKALPSLAACVRRCCMDCQGLGRTARGAFDCESRVCPLAACSPFRQTGRRRPTKAEIHRQCEQCQPDDTEDCLWLDCPLLPLTPWQSGGQPKRRTLTDAQKRHLEASGRSTQFPGERR